MPYGNSPVGIKSRQIKSVVTARQDFLKTVLSVLEREPSKIHYEQMDTILDGFLWNAETYKIVREAAERVFVAIHKELPGWRDYERQLKNG